VADFVKTINKLPPAQDGDKWSFFHLHPFWSFKWWGVEWLRGNNAEYIQVWSKTRWPKKNLQGPILKRMEEEEQQIVDMKPVLPSLPD
jgi:hypothetical protein